MIKRLLNLLILLLICPIVLGAITNQINTTNKIPTSDQSLNLSSSDFGYNGPFSVGFEYSKELGYMLTGRLSQGLNVSNALSLEMQVGVHQRRLNATWGHALTDHQRIKLSAEYLTQEIGFDFDSGKVERWVEQPAYGVTYEYVVPNQFINDVNLNATYSHAISQTLGTKTFIGSDSNTYLNYRRIAGANDASTSAGIDLTPFNSTLVGLQLNYDNVRYDMKYEKGQNSAGFGGTISLHQLMSDHVKFNLLASDRKPYQEYKAGINWLVMSHPGSDVELGFNGTRIIGEHGLDNDTRVGVDVDFRWGGSSSDQPMKYSTVRTESATSNLAQWTTKPAVHMEQVLAIRDQKSVAVNGVQTKNVNEPGDEIPTPNTKFNPGTPHGEVGKPFTVTYKALAIDGIQNDGMFFDPGYLLGSLNLNTKEINDNVLKGSGLSASYSIDPKLEQNATLTISGTPIKDDTSYSIVVKAQNFRNAPEWSPGTQTINITIGEVHNPSVSVTTSPTYTEGDTPDQEIATVNAGQEEHFDTSNEGKNAVKVTAVDTNGHAYSLDHYGLTYTVTFAQDKNGDTDASVHLKNEDGQVVKNSADSPQNYVITATNLDKASANGNFTLTVNKKTENPTVTIEKTNPTYTEGDTPNEEIATAYAGDGEHFDTAAAGKNAVTVEGVDQNGNAFSLDHFGLTYAVNFIENQNGDTNATIVLKNEEGQTVKNSSDSPQKFLITATNIDKASSAGNFTLTVDKQIVNPSVTIEKSTPTYTEGDTPNEEIATAYAGDGEHFDTSAAGKNAITIEGVDQNGNAFNLDHFGLTYTVSFTDDTNANINIKNEDGQTVKNSTDSPQKFLMTAINLDKASSTGNFTLTVNKKAENPTVTIEKSNPTYTEGDAPNEEIAKAYAGDGEHFDTAAAGKNAITVEGVDQNGNAFNLDHFGLTYTVTFTDDTNANINIKNEDGETVKNSSDSPQKFLMTAINLDKASSTGNFTLTVNKKAENPTVTIEKSNPTFTEGDTPNEEIAKAYAGDGEHFDTSAAGKNAITVEGVDQNGNAFNLDHFGMTYTVTFSDDANATIHLMNESGQYVKNPHDSPQSFVMTAMNLDKGSSTGNFTLTINPLTMAYLQCPSSIQVDPNNPNRVYGKSSDTAHVNYTFKGKKSISTNIARLVYATYSKGNKMLQCVYAVKESGTVNIVAKHVPEEDADNIQFTNAPSSFMCNPPSTLKDFGAQLQYCQLQYALK